MLDIIFKCVHNFISKHYFSTSSKAFLPKIYTRTGDKGKSSTFSGERRNKDDDIFEALGTTDELTSTIGFAREFLPEACENINKELQEVQCILQDLASAVATPKSSSNERQAAEDVKLHGPEAIEVSVMIKTQCGHYKWPQPPDSICYTSDEIVQTIVPPQVANSREKTKFPTAHIDTLETWIDEHTKRLPPLNNFILPSGGPGSTALHMARTICRRAERRVVVLVRENEVDEAPMRYLNRLSDYLFTVARATGLATGREEFIYRKPKLKLQKDA